MLLCSLQVYKDFGSKHGSKVYGIFTRDFRTNVYGCRVLITVPACLEILLLSPNNRSWVSDSTRHDWLVNLSCGWFRAVCNLYSYLQPLCTCFCLHNAHQVAILDLKASGFTTLLAAVLNQRFVTDSSYLLNSSDNADDTCDVV